MTVVPRALATPSRPPREWRGGLTSRPACFLLLDPERNACQQLAHDLVQTPHVVPPCSTTGARHERQKLPDFRSNQPVGVE